MGRISNWFFPQGERPTDDFEGQEYRYMMPYQSKGDILTIDQHIWWAEYYLAKMTRMSAPPGVADPIAFAAVKDMAGLHNHIGSTKLAKARYDRETQK